MIWKCEMGKLFLLFTVVPAIELLLLIEVGKLIGAWDTLLIVILTGAFGAFMAKSQGLLLMTNIQKDLARGHLPADSLINGVLIFLGGILLITPGFITDVVGLSLVFPITRKLYILSTKSYFAKKISEGTFKFYTKVNGEWRGSDSVRDVGPESSVSKEPAKIIDLQSYKTSKED